MRRGTSPAPTLQGVFKVGEEVKCLVMGLDPGYTNISLSVAGGWLGGCVVLNGDASKVFPFLDNSEQLQFSNN